MIPQTSSFSRNWWKSAFLAGNLYTESPKGLIASSPLSACIFVWLWIPSCFAMGEFLSKSTSKHSQLIPHRHGEIVRYPCELKSKHSGLSRSVIFRLCRECVCLSKNETTVLHVPFGEAHVHNEHDVLLVVSSHKQVVRFDVSVEKVPCMKVSNSFEQLFAKHEDSFDWETLISLYKKILCTFRKQVHNHEIESGLWANCIHLD